MRLSSPGPTVIKITKQVNTADPQQEIIQNKYYSDNNNSIIKNIQENYYEEQLIRSGNVEKNPGPYRGNSKLKHTGPHILTLIILLVMLINRIKKGHDQLNQVNRSTEAFIPDTWIASNSSTILICLKRGFHRPTIKTSPSHLAILLIIAGDIKTNPGPKIEDEFSIYKQPASVLESEDNLPEISNKININPHLASAIPKTTTHEICIKCKDDDRSIARTTMLQCETCRKSTHLQCMEKSKIDSSQLLSSSFEWICLNQKCKPNHHNGQITEKSFSPNRYSVLKHIRKEIKEKVHNTNCVRKRKNNNKNQPRRKQVNLWSELPKISSKEYVGKEICRSCNHYIQKTQLAVSCNICLRWMHRKCSELSMKKYKEHLEKLKSKDCLHWTCPECRNEDEINYINFSEDLCSEDQLPDEWDHIIKGKGVDEEVILHFNARSVVDKEDEIKEVAKNVKPAAIFITESWLDESCPKGTAVPDNYTIIRKDRSTDFKQKYGKTNGGGVAVLIRKGVEIKTEPKLMSDQNEILWCTLKIKSTKHLIGIIYRASYTELLKLDIDGNTEMEDLLQKTAYQNLMLIGDLNCDTAKPESTSETKTLVSLAEEYNLTNLIKKPTRFSEKTATTIDHIWVRESSLVRKAGTCEGLSDHCGIYAYIKASIPLKDEEITCRSFKSFQAESYRQDIKKFVEESNFRRKMEEKDLNAAFNSWLTSLQKAANKHAPYKTFKPKKDQNHMPWSNRELQDITKTKNMFLKLYRLYKRSDDREKYKAAKNKQTHLKKKCKREYYTKRINEYLGDPKKMWSILKDVTNNNYHENITPDIVNEETANRFNNFFATVGVKVQEKLKIMIGKPKLNQNGVFKFKPETREKIEQLINRIKPNVATGQDGLSARLIKEAATVISEDLREMVNLSYETKTFPDQLKIATVKALHKKGENNNPAQYRPISILTIISKVFERSAVDQLVDYYNSNNLLNPRQHAYRKFHSTITSLFELIETIKSHIDNGNLVAIAALDLSKAFDSLAHNLILNKLDKMGLNETATAWIHSYLCNRKQLVKFGDIKSNVEKVESGVPQGSILGPLLFITCTNDISEELAEYDIFSYADDMQIVVKGKSVKNLGKQLETAIKKANEYYNKNSLLCNPTKTEVMLMGTKMRLSNCQQLEVEVSNGEETKILVGEKSLKLLGMHIDQSLDWNKNTSAIKKRATNNIRNLYKVNQLIPLKARRTLYTSLVTPHFSYGDTIWNNCGAANRNKLQLAQNYAAKSMLGISKYSSSSQALKKLELLPLNEKRNINIAVQVKKSLVGKSPGNINQLYVNQLSKENSRAATKGDLNLPKHRLQQYQQGPFYTSIKTWNSIPPELRANDLTNFKIKLQSFKTKKYLET